MGSASYSLGQAEEAEVPQPPNQEGGPEAVGPSWPPQSHLTLTFTRSISSGIFLCVGEPTLQALGKVPDRLGQGTWGRLQRGWWGLGGRWGTGSRGRVGQSGHSLGMGRSTSGMRISTRPWYSTLSQCLVHCSTGWRSTRLALGSRFSASSCL